MRRGLVALLAAGSLCMASTSHAQFAPPPRWIDVTALLGSSWPIHATSVGTQISLVAGVSSVNQFPGPSLRVDVYVGVTTPDGRFLSFVAAPLTAANPFPTASVVAGPAPIAWLVDFPAWALYGGVEVKHGFAREGWHAVYGVIVPTGYPFSYPDYWLSTSFFPLLVYPATSP